MSHMQDAQSPGFKFARAAPEMGAGLGRLRIPIPSLRLPSVESSPISTAKPTRSERRLAAHSKGSFSVSTPVKVPFALKPLEATPLNSHRSEEQHEVRRRTSRLEGQLVGGCTARARLLTPLCR